MSVNFDLDLWRATPLVRKPFPFLVVPQFHQRSGIGTHQRRLPCLAERGSFRVKPRSLRTFLSESAGMSWKAMNSEMSLSRNVQIDLSDPDHDHHYAWWRTGDGKSNGLLTRSSPWADLHAIPVGRTGGRLASCLPQ